MTTAQNEKILKIEKKRDELNAKIQLLKNRQSIEERKNDTRRKIIAGAFFINSMESNLPLIGQVLFDAGYLEDRDKKLLNLPE